MVVDALPLQPAQSGCTFSVKILYGQLPADRARWARGLEILRVPVAESLVLKVLVLLLRPSPAISGTEPPNRRTTPRRDDRTRADSANEHAQSCRMLGDARPAFDGGVSDMASIELG